VIGLIAQEVQKVLPDVVYQDPVTGYLSVAYTVLCLKKLILVYLFFFNFLQYLCFFISL
jgi:hypothetical protein